MNGTRRMVIAFERTLQYSTFHYDISSLDASEQKEGLIVKYRGTSMGSACSSCLHLTKLLNRRTACSIQSSVCSTNKRR